MFSMKVNNLNLFFNNFSESLKKYSLYFFIILILVIASSDLLKMIIYKDYRYAIIIVFASLCFLFAPIYLFRNNAKIFIIYILFAFLIAVIRYICYYLFIIPFDDMAINLIINSNFSETKELLEGYFLNIFILGIIFVYLLIHIYKNTPKAINSNFAIILSFTSIFFLLMFPKIFPYSSDDSYTKNFKQEVTSSYPGSILLVVGNVYLQYHNMKQTKQQRDNYIFHATQDSSVKGKQIHVLIIGESNRYDHWQINGYEKETSPLLKLRTNLISFSNVSAGAYITELSVPLLLTGLSADNYSKHLLKKGIPGIFNELGFNTYWISNQVDRGNILLHISEAANKKQLISIEQLDSTKRMFNTLDMSLIDELKLILKKSNEKTFVVIHTLGSHWNYSARYPNEFDFFKPSYKTVNAKPNDILFKNVLVNSYDNSVRYTDAIIDSVISLVNSYKGFSSVTFMSDHGVDLMDDDRKLVYRNPIPSKNVAHIPFFIWYSPQFEQIFPNHISVLKANSGRKISSENLLYTLSGMLGIKIENQNVEKDVSNSNFVDTKQLILGNSKVYNIDSLK